MNGLPLRALLRRWTSWANVLRSAHRRVAVGRAAQRDFLLQRMPGSGIRSFRLFRLEPHIQLALRTYGMGETSARPEVTALRHLAILGATASHSDGPSSSSTTLGLPSMRPYHGATPPRVVGELCRETFSRLIDERRRVELSYGGAAAMQAATADGVNSPGHVRASTPSRAALRVPPYVSRPELVLRRSSSERALAPKQREAQMGDGHTTSRYTASPPQAAAPVDIGQLTDEVVRQIDRRIVAHRERVGQI